VYKGMSCRKDGSGKFRGALVWVVCQWFRIVLGAPCAVVWIVKLQGWKGQVKRVFMSGLAYRDRASSCFVGVQW
jgi:hypothetical protein